MEFSPESPEDDCLLDVAGYIVTVPLILFQGGHTGRVTLHFLNHGIVIDILLVINEENMYNEEHSVCVTSRCALCPVPLLLVFCIRYEGLCVEL